MVRSLQVLIISKRGETKMGRIISEASTQKLQMLAGTICQGTPNLEDLVQYSDNRQALSSQVRDRKKSLHLHVHCNMDLTWSQRMQEEIHRSREAAKHARTFKDRSLLEELITHLNRSFMISQEEIYNYNSHAYANFLRSAMELEIVVKEFSKSLFKKVNELPFLKLNKVLFTLRKNLKELKDEQSYALDLYHRQLRCLQSLEEAVFTLDDILEEKQLLSDSIFTQTLVAYLEKSGEEK